ncbi:hypothetical protein [Streptomyces sp. NPDC046942]|uniref:hypothetical protein n=1 Tax=Streptomyces sp. NPDC046942 TaxID=3155137 RepID=UPI0033FFF414
MQWTDESGAAYGGDPYADAGYAYAGAGYAYAYGHEGHGGTLTDTATLPWPPAYDTQGTYPADPFQPQPVPSGQDMAGTTVMRVMTDPVDTPAWGIPHGDVLAMDALTALPPQPGPSAAAAEQVPSEDDPARPVFVDSSGRRQRRVLRAARLLVIPAGGYIALLVSTLLGGPGISAPFFPQSGSHPATPGASAPDPAGTGHPAAGADSAATHGTPRPTTRQSAGPDSRPAAASTAPAVAAPTRTPTPTATPTPAQTRSSRGRALGSSHKPAK